MQPRSPYAENEFYASGVDDKVTAELRLVFDRFIGTFKPIGWRVNVEVWPNAGWIATITTPDGITTEAKLPAATGASERFHLHLHDQYKEYSKRHTSKIGD
jgi:hypothetical protein